MIPRLVISSDGSGHDGYVRDARRVGGHGGIEALIDKLGAHMSAEDRVIPEEDKGARRFRICKKSIKAVRPQIS